MKKFYVIKTKNRMNKKGNFLHILILIGILLIPFMSFPIMPSDYRPISIILLVPIGIIIMLKEINSLKISKDQFILLLFLIITSLQSLLLVDDFSKSVRNILPLFAGIFSYISIRYFLIKNNIDELYNNLLRLSLIIIIIGIIEILSMYHVLPYELKIVIGEIFSGKISSRIQLITMESSWAAKVIIFLIPMFLFFYCKNKSFPKLFYISIIIFIFIFSLEGFLIIFCSLFIYFLIRLFPILGNILRLKYSFKHYFYIFSITTTSMFLLYWILQTQSGYYISRIYKFLGESSIITILSLDNSTFIRIIYPYLGFLIFFDHPFGVGLGNYPVYFNYYINLIPINYSSFSEVLRDIETVSADPKNLYAKILSETGVFGGVIFLSLLVLNFKYLMYNIKNLPNYRLFFLFNMIVTLCSIIQFSSFAYLPFWFGLAINSSFYYKLKKGLIL